MLIKQQKRENLSLLLTKSPLKYIFNLHSEEYSVFFLIRLLYTMYVAFLFI